MGSQKRSGVQGSRAPYHVRKTTLLPSSLKDELVSLGRIDAPKATGRNPDPLTAAGRKERRKLGRKGNNNAQSANKSQATTAPRQAGKPANTATKAAGQSSDRKGKKRELEPDSADHASKKIKSDAAASSASSSKSAPTPLQKLLDRTVSTSSGKSSRSHAPRPKASQNAQEEQDNDEIAWLEAQLGIRRGGKSRKEMEEDGLDDLFDDLDRLDEDLFGDGNGSDDNNETSDALSGSNGDSPENEETADLTLEEDNSDEVVHDEDEASGLDDASEDDMHEVDVDSDSGHSSTDDDDIEDIDTEDLKGTSSINDASQSARSPITAEASATSSKYIPPALRASQAAAKQTNSPQDDPRLRRQLMGLLNRLSPTSFPLLVFKQDEASSLHSIYLSQSRAVVSNLLVRLIPEIVSAQGDGIGETQIVVLSALVKAISSGLLGGMSVSGGKEFGATLMDHLVKQLDGAEHGKKECANLITFLAMLYNMQVIACTLLYDLIRELLSGGLTEESVEAILRVVRVSGTSLRHDDPTSLKQIIQMVNDKHKELAANEVSTRTRFMIEQLANLKNNKTKAPSGVAAEAETSLRKYLTNMARQSGGGAEALRISLADLRSAEEKGKWWLVGAAWSGNPLVDQREDFKNVGASKRDEEETKQGALLKLARKQGMNTETRRNIFVAVMGAEDYIEAAESVSQLGLKEVQQREVIRVLLHCLSNEKAYNPFYTLVIARLLAQSSTQAAHSYQVTLQYALWDHMRSLGETEVGGANMSKSRETTSAGDRATEKKSAHLARAYAWWCAKSGLGLNILKPLPFASLLPASDKFLAAFFSNLFISTQTNSPLGNLPSNERRDAAPLEKIFLSLVAQNASVAQGVAYYLGSAQALRKIAKKNEVVEWAAQVAIEAIQAADNFGY